jgi:hypothetical protein
MIYIDRSAIKCVKDFENTKILEKKPKMNSTGNSF